MSNAGSGMESSVIDNVRLGDNVRNALRNYMIVFEEYRMGMANSEQLEGAEKFYNETVEMYKWK